MKRLGEHTDVYLYGEQSKDHHSGLDLINEVISVGLQARGF